MSPHAPKVHHEPRDLLAVENCNVFSFACVAVRFDSVRIALFVTMQLASERKETQHIDI